MHLRCIMGAAIALLLITASCASLDKFARKSSEVKGTSKHYDVEASVLIDAFKYSLKETGLSVEKEVKSEDGSTVIYGLLGISMQSHGQFVKITIQPDEEGSVGFYYSERRVAMNVTEDLTSIKRKILILVDDYVIAKLEGVDLQ